MSTGEQQTVSSNGEVELKFGQVAVAQTVQRWISVQNLSKVRITSLRCDVIRLRDDSLAFLRIRRGDRWRRFIVTSSISVTIA